MKETLYCLKHPYIKTAVTCKRCKTPLCKDCRLRSEKTAYCSSYCLNIDRAYGKLNPLRDKRDKSDLASYAERLARLAGDYAALLTLLFILAALMLPSKNTGLPERLKASHLPVEKEISKKHDDGKTIPPYGSISRVKNAGKNLAITFDGGSSDSSASAILDILNRKNIKTTFFLTGRFIKKYPHIVKRMVSEGHEVGNHTMSHPHLTTFSSNRKSTTNTGVSYSFLKEELDETARAFKELTGRKMRPLWRAPFGETNREILSWASKIGYRHIAWTVDYKAHQTMDSLDWVTDKSSSLYRTSEEIKENLLSFADKKGRAKGAIILMHLGTERKTDIVHKKLGEIIEAFISRGYNILPVSKLLETEGKRV